MYKEKKMMKQRQYQKPWNKIVEKQKQSNRGVFYRGGVSNRGVSAAAKYDLSKAKWPLERKENSTESANCL